jgi:hypothetical protein
MGCDDAYPHSRSLERELADARVWKMRERLKTVSLDAFTADYVPDILLIMGRKAFEKSLYDVCKSLDRLEALLGMGNVDD